jgi:hypothetical protein
MRGRILMNLDVETDEGAYRRKKQKPDCTRSPERVIEFVRFLLTDDLHGSRLRAPMELPSG